MKRINNLIQFLKDKGKNDVTMGREQMIGLEKAIKWIEEYESIRISRENAQGDDSI